MPYAASSTPSLGTVRAVARAVLACTGNVYAYRRLDDGRVQDLATRRVYPDEDTWRAATWEDLQARMAARTGASRPACREPWRAAMWERVQAREVHRGL